MINSILSTCTSIQIPDQQWYEQKMTKIFSSIQSYGFPRIRRLFFISTFVIIFCFSFFLTLDLIRPDKLFFFDQSYRRRPECTCRRPILTPAYTADGLSSLCSLYATKRGLHQRVIAISLFGPQENKMFQWNLSLSFLHQLIDDVNHIYSDGYTLRIYHDKTVSGPDVICPVECRYPNVDFCNITDRSYIPPKIWRFLPAGDPLVDIMMSRDLDSALTKRERAAVDFWIASNKSFHSMRDHPMHGVPMLGGMWAFRPSLDRNTSRLILEKIYNQSLVERYGGRGDQTFLTHHVWPIAKLSAISHDSFLCRQNFGHQPQPFPTQRSSANETNCFIGCVRPCCGQGKMPFGQCPIECRPKNHTDWLYC